MVSSMMFLEADNKIVRESLANYMEKNQAMETEPLMLRTCDFDGVQYNLTITDNLLQLSLYYQPYKVLKSFGAAKMLSEKYPSVSIVNAISGYDLTLEMKADQLTDYLVKELASLKRNIIGAPFDLCFRALKDGSSKSLSPLQIPFRKTETIYIQPQDDRIVVIYSICFEDKTDQAVVRAFLQEFSETGRHVNNAPPVNFSRDPPMELRGVSGIKQTSDLVGYVSFAIFKVHVETDEKRENAITLIQGFRSYLHYHIKTSKAFLHSRMRKRVESLLHVLNRAHPEKDPSKISKKTISGKTFSRA